VTTSVLGASASGCSSSTAALRPLRKNTKPTAPPAIARSANALMAAMRQPPPFFPLLNPGPGRVPA
jgi:hypothetical protein